MKRLFTLVCCVLAVLVVSAENRQVQYQTWYGDNMGFTSENTATKRNEYFYNSQNQLVRRIQTGLMENGEDWLLTNYELYHLDEAGRLVMTNSLQYGVYDQSHYSLKATNDTVDYAYDAEGRVVQENVHAKKTVTLYSYDEEGHLAKTEIWKSGKLSQTLTYSNFTLGGAQTITSESTSSYNCYTCTLTYDGQGNKTSELRHNTSGTLTAAEYWTYDAQGTLTLYEKKGISGGKEIDSQKTTYEKMDERNTRARSYTYSNSEWKLKGGSTCVTTMATLYGGVACLLKEAKADVEKSCVELTFSMPEALVDIDTEVEFLVYRDGLPIDTLRSNDQIDYHYTDTDVSNGEHEYFIQTIMGGENQNVSNLMTVSLDRTYPGVKGLHATQSRMTTDGIWMVTLAWKAPAITEDMKFVNYNVMKVGTYYATPLLEEEEALTDPKATEVEVSFGIDQVKTVYLQTRYQGATVSSDTITVDVNNLVGKVTEDSRKLRTVETWGDAMGNDMGITQKEVTYYGTDNRVQRVARYSKALGADANDPASWTIYEYTTCIYGESGQMEKQYTRQYGRYNHGEMGFREAQDTIFYEYNVEGQLVRMSNKTGYTEYEYTQDGSLAKEHIVEYATNNLEQTITYSDFVGKDKPTKTISTGTRSSQQWMLETEYDELGLKTSERKSSYKTSTQSYVPSQVQEFYYDESGELASDTVFTIKIVNDIEQYNYKSFTSYEPEEGNVNRVKVVKRVWDSILKKFGNPKTWNVYEYTAINAEKYAPTLTLEEVQGKLNTVCLTVSIPEEQRTAMTAFNLYRDGMEIGHAISYFDTEHYMTDEYGLNGVWTFTDEFVENGLHDYFVEFAQLDATMTGEAMQNNVSNVIFHHFNAELPAPTGLKELSRHNTTTENTEEGTIELNVFVTLGWEAPASIEGLELQGYEVMVVGNQVAENYEDADKSATQYEIAMRGIPQMQIYVDAIYPIGRASSEAITIDETAADALKALQAQSAGQRFYNLRGQQVNAETKGVLINRNKKILNK